VAPVGAERGGRDDRRGARVRVCEGRGNTAAAEERAKNAQATALAKAATDAEEAARTAWASAWLALRAAEETRATRDLDRTVELASLLAERLLGEALRLDPARIALLARQALAEARGARRVEIEAHPGDVAELASHLAELGLPDAAVTIVPQVDLARGSLRLHTDVGSIDAALPLRLERLARALRDALRPA
jgi:flagellar assembly protein FliH/type III secretion protein L